MLIKLKVLRQEHGITQKQLAEAIGVSQQSINKYENHNIEPDINTLVRLADYFNVSLDYLIGRKQGNDSDNLTDGLNEEERWLVQNWRHLNTKQRITIQYVLESYKS